MGSLCDARELEGPLSSPPSSPQAKEPRKSSVMKAHTPHASLLERLLAAPALPGSSAFCSSTSPLLTARSRYTVLRVAACRPMSIQAGEAWRALTVCLPNFAQERQTD